MQNKILAENRRAMRRRLLTQRLSVPEQPMYINPPRLRLLVKVIVYWLLAFVLAVLSSNYLIFVTVPCYVLLVNSYSVFTKIWRMYGYSVVLLSVSSLSALVFSFLVAEPIRNAIGLFTM